MAPELAALHLKARPLSFTETLIPFSHRSLLTPFASQPEPLPITLGSYLATPGFSRMEDLPAFWARDVLFPRLPGIMDVVVGDEEMTELPVLEMISTLKRRKLKMNKHKHKKRLKKTRALRKRLGKIK